LNAVLNFFRDNTTFLFGNSNDKIVGRNGGGFADTSVETSELQRFIFS
jgi:hypothetical protein